jgi:hypothetical protein
MPRFRRRYVRPTQTDTDGREERDRIRGASGRMVPPGADLVSIGA